MLNDFKNAKRLTDYDWEAECLMTEQMPKQVMGRRPQPPMTQKLNKIDMSNVNFSEANFSLLHKTPQYPN